MKTPRDFPISLPPGTVSRGINLDALGIKSPAPKTKAKAKARKGGDAWPALDALVAPRWPLLVLDPSSTATGWTAQDEPLGPRRYGLIRPPGGWGELRRIDRIVADIAALAGVLRPSLVAMEWCGGHHYQSVKRKVTNQSVLGAAQGAVRHELVRSGHEVVCVKDVTWTRRVKKEVRAKKIRIDHPDYAAWTLENRDSGLDVADSLGLYLWYMANAPTA